MTENNTYININGCLTQEGIKYFLQNDEENALQNKIEEHLKECDLCRSAVVGYKKLNNIQDLDKANNTLNERFSNYNKNKKRAFSSHLFINMVTVAAVLVIAILIVKNFTTINYVTEEPIYNEELALLSKDEITRPSPPKRPQQKLVRNYNKETISKHTMKDVKKENVDVVVKKNSETNNIPSKNTSKSHKPTGYTDKTLVDKSYTEFQITLPVEVDRRGYSYYDNNLITASYEKGVALSAMPSFNGKGLEGFVEYVSKNIEYPAEARDYHITGIVEIQFAVDVDGTVKDVEIKKGINPILDNEAYRLIKNSPKWIPGFVNGRATKIYLRFPVSFRIN